MKDSQILFWDVDTQVDFMDPAGKLYVPGAENVIANVARLNQWAAQNAVPVVASVDAHRPGDPEFADYPPHCLAGTEGQKKVEGTLLPQQYVIPNRKVDLPAGLFSNQQVIIEKQATDVFTNPNISRLLELAGKRRIILYGVVTEICVEKAARGLVERGYRVDVVDDAIRHLDAAKGRATVEFIVQHGGRVLKTADVLTGALAAQPA